VSIRRHARFIASLVALAITLTLVIIPLIPRKYSAEALIYPNLFSHEQGKAVALGSVDAAAIVTSEARLIRSDPILGAVAARLGLNPVAATSQSWATQCLDWIRVMILPETYNNSPFDRTVTMLRNQVEVMNDTRSYLISISFTGPSADEAARVANAFAIEYLREKDLQRRRNAVAAAEGELWRQLAIYGEKHPKVLQAAEGLDAARASLQAATSLQDEVMSDENVKLAVPNRTPTSPKGFVILRLSFLSALLAGIGLAIWRDRRGASTARPAEPR
jgi:uncharacterized protein involved in exopolysaccharide biosynthesis